MTDANRRKRELLADIAAGPASVVEVSTFAVYDIGAPTSKVRGTVSICLTADYRVAREVMPYTLVGAERLPLTKREATSLARLVAATMRRRARPWTWAG